MLTDKEREALIKAATEQAQKNLTRLDAKVLGELETLYQGVMERLSTRLTQYSPDGYFAQQHLKPFLSDLGKLLKQMAGARRSLLDVAIDEAARVGVEPAVTANATGVNIAVAHSVKAVWELQLADGLQLSERLWRLDRGAKEAIGQALRAAVARGQNPNEAARDFLRAEALRAKVGEELLTGQGSALYNAQRLFQTETKRAHALSYVESNRNARGLIGYRYMLSPLHRRVDICDRHANADLHGLGRGVYPADKIRSIFPAHPNTRSYIVAVFA